MKDAIEKQSQIKVKRDRCSIPPEKRIQPGTTRNPFGRPPAEKCIPDILRRIGDEPAAPDVVRFLSTVFKKKFVNMTNRDAMLMRVYYNAELGRDSARDFVAERTEGKVREYVDITSGDKTLQTVTQRFDLNKLTPEKLLHLRRFVREILHPEKAGNPADAK